MVAAYGQRCFKLKVGGDRQADIERLVRIAGVLDTVPEGLRVTLDGNEQYEDVDAVVDLWEAMEAEPALQKLCAATLFIEQPIKRQVALSRSVAALARHRPVIIDESDGEIESFVRARALGYSGVSSKDCKGFYKSVINLARCRLWNAEGEGSFFLSGEDLTTQAGLAVQQDLALVALLGLGRRRAQRPPLHRRLRRPARCRGAAPTWRRIPTCTSCPAASRGCASATAA